MKNSLINNKTKYLLREIINRKIDLMLAEQQMPAPPPPVPGAPADPNAAMLPPAGDPTMAVPGEDPNAMGAPPPGDPNAAPPPEGGEEAPPEEGEEGGEDTGQVPEDPAGGVVDKIKEEMETDQNKGIADLVKIAKGYIQDFGLLDKGKKYQALSVVEKLREEEVPELNKVADYLEKFLLGA